MSATKKYMLRREADFMNALSSLYAAKRVNHLRRRRLAYAAKRVNHLRRRRLAYAAKRRAAR